MLGLVNFKINQHNYYINDVLFTKLYKFLHLSEFKFLLKINNLMFAIRSATFVSLAGFLGYHSKEYIPDSKFNFTLKNQTFNGS